MIVARRFHALLFLLLIVPCLAADTPPRPPAKAAAERTKPKVTPIDLKILRKADEILADESKWNRKCDREYKPEDKTWSIYTALQKASLEVTGKHVHRQAALEEVRLSIQARGKKYQHRLMDFNNDPETKFADIKKVLAQTIERIAPQVEGKGASKVEK